MLHPSSVGRMEKKPFRKRRFLLFPPRSLPFVILVGTMRALTHSNCARCCPSVPCGERRALPPFFGLRWRRRRRVEITKTEGRAKGEHLLDHCYR